VTEAVRPPRSLVLPFRHGFPLDTPNDAVRQRRVLEAALKMLEDESLVPPVIVDYVP